MITRRFYDQQIHSMVIEALRVRVPRILRNMRFLFKATLDGQMMVLLTLHLLWYASI